MRMEMNRELNGWIMKIQLEEERDSFGTEMLKHNEVKGVLGACVHMVDQCPLYLYEIGDRLALSEYIKKHVFTLGEWKELLRQLMELLELTKDYFLSEKDILLQPDTLFYDEREKQLYVLYLDGYDGDVADGIASVLEYFMNHMNHQDRELVFFVYGLHGIVKDRSFSFQRLREYMEEYGGEEKKRKEREDMFTAETSAKEEKPKQKEEQEKRIERRTEKSPPKRQKREGDGGALWKAIMIVAIGVLFLLIAWKSQALLHPVTKEIDVQKTILFLIVLVVAEGVALWKECNGLWGRKSWRLILVPTDKGREEICVGESPCYIGSNPERANKIVDMSEISPVHVKIVLEEERIYLIDQESDNGTWKNDKQLIPWERNRLQDGDTIRLSSLEYKVVVPSEM